MSVFEVALESFIDMNHELVLLSKQIDWEAVESEFAECYCADNGHQHSLIRIARAELLPEAEGSEEVLQACRHRAFYRPPEIRPPDDAELPQGNPW